MLAFVGMGLWDEKDITLKGLEMAKRCDRVYAELYTSIMGTNMKKMEEIIGKRIEMLEREELEEGNRIIEEAKRMNVCLLVPGDPMTATTHVELRLRAMEEGIETGVIHGISIITASAGLLGLQIYKFGRVVSIARPYDNYFPLSPYERIKENLSMGLHSLLLLDIGEKPMTANEGMEILLEMERRKKEGVISPSTLIAVVARASSDDAIAKAGYIEKMMEEDFGETPHSIIIPGKLHFMEAKALVYIAGAPEKIMDEK